MLDTVYPPLTPWPATSMIAGCVVGIVRAKQIYISTTAATMHADRIPNRFGQSLTRHGILDECLTTDEAPMSLV